MRNFTCLIFLCALLAGCSALTPAATLPPTITPTSTYILPTTPADTSTATITLTTAPSRTPTHTKTPTVTPTPQPSPTPTPTQTPLGGGSGEIAYIGYVREGDGGLKLFNLQTNAAEYLNKYGTWLVWSLDGTALAYLGFPLTSGPSRYQVCTYQPERKEEHCVALENDNINLPFAVSSHGTTILMEGYDNNTGSFEIYQVNPADGSQRVIANGSSPTWAPDGKLIAFTMDGRIFTMALDGSEPKLLVAQSGNDRLTFSPDGTRLAYTSHKNGNTDVYSASLDGAQTRHSTAPGYDLYPAWSPDGKQLAYVSPYQMSYSGFQGDIFVVDITTNTNKKITDQAAAKPSAPSWSPDGQWITFHGCQSIEDKERCALFIVRSDGSELIQLSEYELHTSNPVWRP